MSSLVLGYFAEEAEEFDEFRFAILESPFFGLQVTTTEQTQRGIV